MEKPSSPELPEGPGLLELEPSPVDDTPIELRKDGYFPANSTSPSARTTTLGFGHHGAAYYCETFLLAFAILRTDCSSDPSSEVFVVCFHGIRRLPRNQHRCHSFDHSIHDCFRQVSPSDSPLLPNITARATPHSASHCRTRLLWHCSPHTQKTATAQPKRR
jgi:hypothetical protein